MGAINNSLTREQIQKRKNEFDNDVVIKYLMEQIERVLSLGTPKILFDMSTFKISHHFFINEISYEYWKDQLNRYIEFEYKDLINARSKPISENDVT